MFNKYTFKKWNAGFLFAVFFLNKAERGIMHYIFSVEKVSICGVKNRWWNTLRMHKTSRILLFLVSSQVRFDRLLQPEGWESNKTRARENLLLFALIPEGVEKTPFAHNELEMMTMARHQTFSRNFGPDHVLI